MALRNTYYRLWNSALGVGLGRYCSVAMSPPLAPLYPTLPWTKYLVFVPPSLSAPEVLRARGSARLGVNRDLIALLCFGFRLHSSHCCHCGLSIVVHCGRCLRAQWGLSLPSCLSDSVCHWFCVRVHLAKNEIQQLAPLLSTYA